MARLDPCPDPEKRPLDGFYSLTINQSQYLLFVMNRNIKAKLYNARGTSELIEPRECEVVSYSHN